MSENQQGPGDGQGSGAITDWTQKYVLPQGEEPVVVAMIIGTKSGKIYIQPGDNIFQFLSLAAAGIETASQVLKERIQTSSIVKPKLILPNNVRYPKFGRN